MGGRSIPVGVPSPAAYVQIHSSVETPAVSTDFETFYREMFPRVYGYVRFQVGNVETAKDIVSSAFLKAYQHRRNAPSKEAMTHWLFRIVRNTLIDYWRVEGRRNLGRVSLEELGELPGRGRSPEASYADREKQAMLLETMARLPERDRTVLALRFVAQRTNREIAAILDLSERAVSMRLLRALRRLRKQLDILDSGGHGE